MSNSSHDSFWTKDPWVLLKPNILPEHNMTKEEILNVLTRLVLIIGIVMLATNFKFSWFFIILSLTIIIIIHYSQMNRNIERYSNFPQLEYPFESYKDVLDNQCPRATSGYPQEHLSFEQANNLSTLNKTEVGVDFFSPPIQIQERSMVPPIIVPKAYDKEIWTPNDGVNQTNVNKRIMEDVTYNFSTNDTCYPPERMVVGKSHGGLTNAGKLMSADENQPSYFSDYLNLPTETMFNQDVQPKPLGDYVTRHQPINGNYAISEIPNWQESPESRYLNTEENRFIEAMPNKRGQAAFGSYDPQLIRDNGPAGRRAEMPVRSEWSARASPYEAQGTIDYNQIFDPRFTGYGDPYSSYLDVDKGNISYYYGDTVDVYRHPVFISRSKVDFIENREPMGKIKPLYRREKAMCLNDAIDDAENRWKQDTTNFRESLMGSQMQKVNAESWQARHFPKRLMNSK